MIDERVGIYGESQKHKPQIPEERGGSSFCHNSVSAFTYCVLMPNTHLESVGSS